MLVAQLLNMCAREVAGDPPAGGSSIRFAQRLCRRRCNLSVQGHGGFQRHQRRAVADVFGKTLIETPGLVFQSSNLDMHSGGPELLEAASADRRIGVRHRSHDSTNSRGDDGISARRRPPLMGAGLKIDKKCSAICFWAGVIEGPDLGVFYPVVGVSARAHNVAVRVHHHRTHVRVGRSKPDTLPRKVESAVQKLFVSGLVGHGDRQLPRRNLMNREIRRS